MQAAVVTRQRESRGVLNYRQTRGFASSTSMDCVFTLFGIRRIKEDNVGVNAAKADR